MATWTTASRREAAGVVTVTLTYPTGSNLDMEVLSIGNISYEFDLPENDENSRSIGMIIGDSSMTIRDTLSDASSAYDLLTPSGAPQDYQVTISVVANSGTTYNFRYYFSKIDVSTDDRTRITEIKLHPTRFSDSTVRQYFASQVLDSNGANIVPTTIDAYFGGDGNKAGFAADFIEDMLATIDASATFVLKSKNSYLVPFASATTNGNYSLLGDDATLATGAFGGLFNLNSNYNCFEAVGVYAASEGAIYGSGFGFNFFVNRRDDSDNVELSYNDLEGLKAVTTDRQFRSIRVDSDVDTFLEEYGPYASKNFSYTAPNGNCLLIGQYDGANTIGTFISASGNAEAAVDAYGASFAASDEKHIEAVIFGFDSVLPHRTFKFDSSVPSRYRNATYRMSSIEYSIEEDKITVKAYQIA